MGKMEKQEFMDFMENVYDTYELDFESIFLFKTLQFEFEYNEEERTCTVTSPVTDFMLNPMGLVHGGVYAFIADSSMGHLNHHFKEQPFVTLELKTSYYKAAVDGEIRATASYAREGRTISFLESDITNSKGELLARTTGTFYLVPERK